MGYMLWTKNCYSDTLWFRDQSGCVVRVQPAEWRLAMGAGLM